MNPPAGSNPYTKFPASERRTLPARSPLKPKVFQVLLSLADDDGHGYGIMQGVLDPATIRPQVTPPRSKSEGRLRRAVRQVEYPIFRIAGACRVSIESSARIGLYRCRIVLQCYNLVILLDIREELPLEHNAPKTSAEKLPETPPPAWDGSV